MNIQTKKYQLIEWITNIHDNKLIEKLFTIAEKTDWWNAISETEKEQIEKGIKDIKEGKTVKHSVVRKRYEKN